MRSNSPRVGSGIDGDGLRCGRAEHLADLGAALGLQDDRVPPLRGRHPRPERTRRGSRIAPCRTRSFERVGYRGHSRSSSWLSSHVCNSTTSLSCSTWSRPTVWPSNAPLPQTRADFDRVLEIAVNLAGQFRHGAADRRRERAGHVRRLARLLRVNPHHAEHVVDRLAQSVQPVAAFGRDDV